MILKIERSWGRDPGWFSTLEREQQIQLLALYRVENTPREKLEDKPDKRAIMMQRINEYKKQDRPQAG